MQRGLIKRQQPKLSKKARAQKTAESGGAKLFTLIFYHILNSSLHQQFGTTLSPLKHGLTCKCTKQQQIANCCQTSPQDLETSPSFSSAKLICSPGTQRWPHAVASTSLVWATKQAVLFPQDTPKFLLFQAYVITRESNLNLLTSVTSKWCYKHAQLTVNWFLI